MQVIYIYTCTNKFSNLRHIYKFVKFIISIKLYLLVWYLFFTWHLDQTTWLTSEASCTGGPRPFSSVLGSRPFVPPPVPLGCWRIVPSETKGYPEYFPCLHPCNVMNPWHKLYILAAWSNIMYIQGMQTIITIH